MLSIKARLRPMRSARKPKSMPPMPEARSVSVYRRPEVAFDMPRSRMTWVSTSAYSIASKASSIQPRAAASSVRRCSVVACRSSRIGPMAMRGAIVSVEREWRADDYIGIVTRHSDWMGGEMAWLHPQSPRMCCSGLFLVARCHAERSGTAREADRFAESKHPYLNRKLSHSPHHAIAEVYVE